MTTEWQNNEEDWVAGLISGDQAAFEALFNRYYARLVLYAQKLSLSKAEAEDVVAESFTKFWLNRQKYRNIPVIRSFLYLSTKNATIDLIRQRKKNSGVLPEQTDLLKFISESSAEKEQIYAEVIGAIYSEIKQLPLRCREVMELTYSKGLNTRQIAEELNMSVSNVTSQRSRAVGLLKIALLEKYPFLPVMLVTSLICVS